MFRVTKYFFLLEFPNSVTVGFLTFFIWVWQSVMESSQVMLTPVSKWSWPCHYTLHSQWWQATGRTQSKGILMVWLLSHKHIQKLWWSVETHALLHPLKLSPSLHTTLQTHGHFISPPNSQQKLSHITGAAAPLNNPSVCLYVMSGGPLMCGADS